MKTCHLKLHLCAFIALFALGAAPATQAKDNWVRLRSQNFVLVGNADQKKIRDIAIRLEQFRDVFTQLLPGMKYTSTVPTTIMVFKDMKSYGPFRTGNVAGYFQPGQDENFLTLSADYQTTQNPYSVMFHEYTHLLVHNSNFSDVPDWFNEGLAEYYSTFDITDDQKVKIGVIVPEHLYILRKEKLLPLATLFSVDHDSPYYNEGEKQSIFYAESWLLMHYFIQQNNGARLPQMAKFLELLLNRIPAAEAFHQAFNSDFSDMEKELQAYLKQESHRISVATFKEKLGTSKDVSFEPLDDATALGYQGDLAYHARLKSSEEYLQKALQLDPGQARALLALGRMYMLTGRAADSVGPLERAVAADDKNGYAHYFYADSLMQQGQSSGAPLSPEQVSKIRVNLKAAIDLEPGLNAAYGLYAYLSLLDGVGLNETIALLQKAIAASPGDQELHFMLAQCYLNIHDYDKAKSILNALVQVGKTEELRDRSKAILQHLQEWTDANANRGRRTGFGDPGPNGPTGPASGGTGGTPKLVRRDGQTDPDTSTGSGSGTDDINDVRRYPLRDVGAGETRVRGSLVKIECPGGDRVILTIKLADRVMRLFNDDLATIKFMSYSPDFSAGAEISCGPIKSANSALVTYHPLPKPGPKGEGEVFFVEFVPAGLKIP